MSLETAEKFVGDWVSKNDYMHGGNKAQKYIMKKGLTEFSKLILRNDHIFDEKITKAW